MKIKLCLTAPEYAPLIVNYKDWFLEDHAYPIEWNSTALPRIGDCLSFEFIKDLLQNHVDLTKVPSHWEIMYIIWHKEGEEAIPTLHLVGK